MKSRISFFDKAVLRKDITRFAPLWAIYLIGGLLVMLTGLADLSPTSAANDLASTIGPFSIINLIYAALCAQLLFGDLFNTRHCNALHALPLRRETWFTSHVLSGLMFSLVPHAVGVVLMMTMLGELWFVGLLWLLGMVLEYLFFFGLAVFSVFCTGNRFAMAAVYGILNFASLIAYWFITTIYEPLLYGVSFPDELFRMFSPVIQMCVNQEMILFKWKENGSEWARTWQYQGLGEGWWYLAICAVIGVSLLAVSLLLYRRRKLECAGDFIAVKPLEPIFAVVFTVSVGCVFAVVEQMFTNDYLLFLCVGLVIGWFVSQMLLQRTVKVFKGKTFLRLAILLLALGASILLTWLDPLGVTRWVPEPHQVAAVEIDTGSQINLYDNEYLKMTAREDIQKIITAHKEILEVSGESGRKRTVSIRYTLKDGHKISRTYTVCTGTKEWNILQSIYNTPESILGYSDWDTFVEKTDLYWEGDALQSICWRYAKYSGENVQDSVLHETMRRSLLEALRKDCEEGLLPQTFASGKYESKFWLELMEEGAGYQKFRSLMVYENSRNTLAWMETYKHILTFIPESK